MCPLGLSKVHLATSWSGVYYLLSRLNNCVARVREKLKGGEGGRSLVRWTHPGDREVYQFREKT
jgi:hypothetical protein